MLRLIAALTVHGRTRDQHYTGTAEYETIAAIKAMLTIPVIANGSLAKVTFAWNLGTQVKRMLAEQQFGAVPLVIDSRDGTKPGSYNALLLAGKDSPVKSVQEIRGQDFTLVDPASTSGNLFPRVMLIEEGKLFKGDTDTARDMNRLEALDVLLGDAK